MTEDQPHPADTPKILVLLGIAGVVESGQELGPGLHYVKEWEVDDPKGVGLELTHDIALAKRYDGFRDALLAYRASPARKPTRADGKPNRPLTAFHVEIRDAP